MQGHPLPVAKSGFADQQKDLWERFQAAYNSIDHLMRQQLGTHNRPPSTFNSVLKDYDRKYRLGDSDVDYLRVIHDLRSLLIHEKKEADLQLATPTGPVVQRLESIQKRISDPPRVYPHFKKKVEKVSPTDSLAAVLRIISQRDYSQFPVFDGKEFRGLLTENGITRWLAENTVRGDSLIELDEVFVSDVLQREEKCPNWKFIPRSSRINEAKGMFTEEALLEAALITQHGKSTEELLGLITRWDISVEL
jgi:predicted transcriptional regulator